MRESEIQGHLQLHSDLSQPTLPEILSPKRLMKQMHNLILSGEDRKPECTECVCQYGPAFTVGPSKWRHLQAGREAAFMSSGTPQAVTGGLSPKPALKTIVSRLESPW